MNISVAVSLNGKNINISDGLKESLVILVEGYVKQILGGGKAVKKAKGVYKRKPKDPNAPKREKRPKITPEEKENILKEASHFQHLTASRAAGELHLIVHRSTGTLFGILKKAEKEGRLQFAQVG